MCSWRRSMFSRCGVVERLLRGPIRCEVVVGLPREPSRCVVAVESLRGAVKWVVVGSLLGPCGGPAEVRR